MTCGADSLEAVSEVPVAVLRDSDSPRSAGVDPDHVQVLVDVGTGLPPIVVQRDTMRVIDGMHRLRAAEQRGDEHIRVRFFDGGDEDAFVLAVRLNAEHGLPLTLADRTNAARRVLRTHPEWSDQAIAAVTGVSDKTVAALRLKSAEPALGLSYRVGRDGRRRPLNPAEGRLRAGEVFAANLDTPLREAAAKAGISLNTARDVRERLRRGESPVPEQRRGTPAAVPDEVCLADRREVDPNQALSLTEDWRTKLEVLARDPALRFTEEGRAMLRLLHAQMIGAATWERFIERVPPHSVFVVAEVARRCADAWQQFARRLEGREDDAA
ncbi:ParB-like chromosome segregation protein Spo0J [Crossiella equi]|uniref:ParB-like chromosome segregation protein Spo0J n=1 Tax=Crossiella equi TaxID=130796 RepID=A0ABS5A881_9PSEU|nr:ParB N-terminal domain-containing protein [Crossiella equi]MBP2471910.1 ParB-like chromosome segregation protein Spo0J [Crossiella equi]